MKKFNSNEKNWKSNLVRNWESLVLKYRAFSQTPSGRLAIEIFFLILKILVKLLVKFIF